MNMEQKAIPFELKDIDKTKRVAIIAHAVYDNIDLTNDISRKGMFTKSWNENKNDINFYLNHNDEQAPGKVMDVYEDDHNAYTKAWLGTHTLGNDVLIMMDEGVIKKASFGYAVDKSKPINVKGRKVRELNEVKHYETSVLTKMPANPKAGVRQVIKSFYDALEVKTLSPQEQTVLKTIISGDQSVLEELVRLSANVDTTSDLYTWVNFNISRRADMLGDLRSQLKYNSGELKQLNDYVVSMEKFCRNTKASDECIEIIQTEIKTAKQLISEYNTDFTQAGQNPLEPMSSVEGKSLLDVLTNFKKTLN